MDESKINVTEWNQTANVDITIPIIWVVAKNSKEKNEIFIAFLKQHYQIEKPEQANGTSQIQCLIVSMQCWM